MPLKINAWEDIINEAPEGALFFSYRRPTDNRERWLEGGYKFPLRPGTLDRAPAENTGQWVLNFYDSDKPKAPTLAYAAAVKGKTAPSPAKTKAPSIGVITDLQVEFVRGLTRDSSLDEHQKADVGVLLMKAMDRINSGNDALTTELAHVRTERQILAQQLAELRPGTFQFLIENHADSIFDFLGTLKDGLQDGLKILRSVPSEQVEKFSDVYRRMEKQQEKADEDRKALAAQLAKLESQMVEERKQAAEDRRLMLQILQRMPPIPPPPPPPPADEGPIPAETDPHKKTP